MVSWCNQSQAVWLLCPLPFYWAAKETFAFSQLRAVLLAASLQTRQRMRRREVPDSAGRQSCLCHLPAEIFLFFLGCVSAQLRSALPFFLVKSQGIKCDGRADLGQTPASPDDKHQWPEVSAETSVCLCECFSDVLNVIAVIDLSKEVIAAKSGCLSMDPTLAHVLIWRQHGQNQ